ncbi:hypothetical protein [Arenimonas donghaensis]|uniref:Uncharacterized protein n=1 Tax=Arenimonas donghaensis DSM 18148 = HO3-R19 TaxID=1121014 RepID=A0A087MK26_9GAMM|nr:hypothetical protein [Arenimonas donghaensis]KFL37229.1 hypothetical protein N788_10340 [Arenimonas donghaensis DSM 18148 = HO3-R19]
MDKTFSSPARRHAWLLMLVAVASCSSQDLPFVAAPLPDASLARPYPGCTIVSVSPAEALPEEGGRGVRRALMRHEADCLPDFPQPSDWHEPYRITFEQEFSEVRQSPGGVDTWVGGETRFLDDSAGPRRQVEAATEGMGKNCALLLDKLQADAAPCITAIDPDTGRQFQAALDDFRAKLNFQINAHGETHLAAIRMGRDQFCLENWWQVQRQLEGRFDQCVVK